MSARAAGESPLVFRPIDIESAAEVAVRFRADSFACSFGSADRFYEADGLGHERYFVWLRGLMQSMPGSCLHVWHGDAIVGQIEMSRFRNDPRMGYVNLYYLAPPWRNRGLGRLLDGHATAYLRARGFRVARLNVSPTNLQALRFYRKCGWLDLGTRPGHPEVHSMEKALVADDAS